MGSDKQSSRFAFDRGSLLISTESSKFSIHGWPEPEATEQEGSHEPHPARPAFRLVMRQGENRPSTPADKFISSFACDFREADQNLRDQKMQAYAAFRASLPAELGCAIERFQSHQWNLIDLIRYKREALDLAISNPVLAFLFANNDELRKLTARSPAVQARWHIHKRQREIAGWLGFPGAEATVKLLKKIVPESISPTDGRFLLQALTADPAIARMVAHLKRINVGVLRLVSNWKLFQLVTIQLLEEVSGNDEEVYFPRTADLLIDVRYMFEKLHPDDSPKPFKTARRIQEMHAQLMTELQQKERHEQEMRAQRIADRLRNERLERERRFLSAKRELACRRPPIAGSANIVPLTTKDQLQAEGEAQHHCVGQYFELMKEGELFVYKVLKPERATLSLVRDRNGDWGIGQLRLSCNRTASAETVYAVHRWLTAGERAAAAKDQW